MLSWKQRLHKSGGGSNKTAYRGGLWWLLALMGALWVSGSPEAQAQTYAVGDPIKGVLTARSRYGGYVSATDTLTVSAGTDVSFSVSGPANNGTAQDIDYQMANGVAVAGAYDNVTYAWTVDGRALLGTGHR